MRSKLDPTPAKDARLHIALDREQKRRIFEAAAKLGMSPSQFVRATSLRAADRAAA